MEQANRRGEIASLAGLVVQSAFAAAILLIGYFANHSLATRAAGWYMLGGTLIWLTVFLVFRHQKLRDREVLELEQLRRQRQTAGQDTSGLFGLPGEAGPETLPAARRAQWIRRWLLPIATLLIAAYEIAAGLAWIHWQIRWPLRADDWPAIANPVVTAWFVAGIALLCFLFSRYTAGMARQPEWRLLRAGSSYMFGGALVGLFVVIALAVAQLFDAPVPEHYLAYAIPLAMLAIGAECILNFVLDIYRPRAPGVEDRPAFDSRLLGLFSEPGGLAHTVAEAINYQFGFEVSKTWLYQLLERAITPLIAFGLATMLLLTALVVVDADEQAVLERFGRPVGGPTGTLQPGLHLKWPWPIDRVYKYPVQQIQELMLGFGKEPYRDVSEAELQEQLKLILWTSERHGLAPELFLVSASRQPTAEGGPTVVVPSLLHANVLLQYRVSNVFDYHYSSANPQELLEAVAYRELALFVAGTNLDDLLGSDRAGAADYLKQRIQHRSHELRLGVTITWIGLQNIHPPRQGQVAEAFQEVIGALAEKEAQIRKAEAEENQILAEVAGQKKLALDLVDALRQLESLREQGASPDQQEAAQQTVQRLFDGADVQESDGTKHTVPGVAGQAAVMLADAQAYRWQRENEALGKAQRFRQDLTAYRASPAFFKLRKYLQTLAVGLADARKYVIAADPGKIPLIVEMDLRTVPRPEVESFQPSEQPQGGAPAP